MCFKSLLVWSRIILYAKELFCERRKIHANHKPRLGLGLFCLKPLVESNPHEPFSTLLLRDNFYFGIVTNLKYYSLEEFLNNFQILNNDNAKIAACGSLNSYLMIINYLQINSQILKKTKQLSKPHSDLRIMRGNTVKISLSGINF